MWRERNPDHQLGKIADAGLLGRVGPSVIEDELAHAVSFEIERTRGDDSFLRAFANDEMIGGPSGLPRCGAGMFHREEPVVFEERGIVGREQSVPYLARNFLDSLDDCERFASLGAESFILKVTSHACRKIQSCSASTTFAL